MIRLWKWTLSFLKTNWQLSDYPIRFRHVEVPASSSSRFQPVPWVAQVVGWWQMSGHGQTRAEAHAELITRFDQYRSSGKNLPRPGSRVPLEFAPTDRVRALEHVARDFMSRVLGYDFDQCLVTDESSLWDFHCEESNAGVYNTIALLYGIDISDIEDGNLVAIFERIDSR
jgi:hypothetical protein